MSESDETLIEEFEPISNLVGYLNYIFGLNVQKGELKCYRGQGNKEWGVKPSVLRGLRENAENNIISELFSEMPEEFSNDKLMFDKLVRAQHYNLPTRLLDVSLNPLVALYFACENKEEMDSDGCVYTYHFPENRVKFADSDAVSLICNLSRLSDTEKESITENHSRYKQFANDKLITKKQSIDRFRSAKEISRLLHFVREEKSYFLNGIMPNDLFRYYLVHPRKNNKRVIAQSGLFIAAGLLQYKKLDDAVVVNKLIIPSGIKTKILEDLNELNINEKSMFPEVEKVSAYIKDKWKE